MPLGSPVDVDVEILRSMSGSSLAEEQVTGPDWLPSASKVFGGSWSRCVLVKDVLGEDFGEEEAPDETTGAVADVDGDDCGSPPKQDENLTSLNLKQ